MPKRCESCAVANINGVRCHEHGCPDAWRDEVRECTECGGEFTPEHRGQAQCDEACAAAYRGCPTPDDLEREGDATEHDTCDCGEPTYTDCFGRERCEVCDPPCPGCDDGGGPR